MPRVTIPYNPIWVSKLEILSAVKKEGVKTEVKMNNTIKKENTFSLTKKLITVFIISINIFFRGIVFS